MKLLHSWRQRSVAERLLWVGGLAGLILVFLIPPYQVADEPTHFYRAYEISEGRLMAQRLAVGTGDELPASLMASNQPFTYVLFQPDQRVPFSLIQREFQRPLNPDHTVPTRFENTALYPPLAYAPQALAIGLGRIVEAPPIVLLYLARLGGLLAWFILMSAAIRLLPQLGLAIAVLALTPMALYQAASSASDGLTMALAFYFVVLVVRLARSAQPLTTTQLGLLGLTATALAFCKAPYVLLVLLVLLIPVRQFQSLKRYIFCLGLLVLLPLALAGGWALAAQASFVNFRAGVDQAAQLQFILHQPLAYLKILVTTYFSTYGDYLPIQYIGILGWLDTRLPLWLTILNWVVIALAALVALPERLLNRWQAAWTALVGVGIIGAISTLLYLTWTPPRGPLVEGLQGRYFLPLGILLPVIIGGWLTLKPAMLPRLHRVIVVATILILTGTLITVTLRYYG